MTMNIIGMIMFCSGFECQFFRTAGVSSIIWWVPFISPTISITPTPKAMNRRIAPMNGYMLPMILSTGRRVARI